MEQNPPSLPKGASKNHQSAQIQEFNEYYGTPRFQSIIQQEATLIYQSSLLIRQPKNIWDSFTKGATNFLFEEARDIAAVEAASLVIRYPQMVIRLPNVPNFYRLARTQELVTGTPRGGKRLFIGSSRFTHELLAYYMEPPTVEVVGQTVGKFDVTKGLNLHENTDAIPFVKGYAIGLEPAAADIRFLTVFERTNEHFGVPKNLASIQNLNLGEALSTGSIPGNLDAIVINRADGRIFYSDPKPIIFLDENADAKAKKELEDRQTEALRTRIDDLYPLVASLDRLLSQNGVIIVTFGQGNNADEVLINGTFMYDMEGLLPAMGYKVNERIPLIFRPGSYELYFGDGQAGALGCLSASKLTKRTHGVPRVQRRPKEKT